MKQQVLDFYLQYSRFTYPGLYKSYLKTLPDDIAKIGHLVRKQLIHRTTLRDGNTGTNANLEYGDMTKIPMFTQPEDDYFITASSILAELFRRDERGIIADRSSENKLILTCRSTTILTASILKTKGIPCRVRSGFASYFPLDPKKRSWDHWVNEYWNKKENRWVLIDVDGCFHNTGFNMFDIPKEKFDYSPQTWIKVREKKSDENHFWNAAPKSGLAPIAWELFYDFHCLMNNEIIYIHVPEFLYGSHKFNSLTKDELEEIDNLARLMENPDDNFGELQKIWETNKKFRILKGGLL